MDVETRYLELEKLALALVVASRKLSPYFHTHSIEVLTNYPLHQVLQNPEASSKLLQWAIELGQFEVKFCTITEIKGQALADFIVEFTYTYAAKVARTKNGVKTAKVIDVGDKENSTPTQEDTK